MTKIRKLTRREFSRAIKRGLGRALLHVKEYGDEGIENEIKDALLTNYVYDMQIEGLRAWWLFDIVQLTGRTSVYAEYLARNFCATRETAWHYAHRYDLAARFYELGFEEFRQLMFTNFHKIAKKLWMYYCGMALIDVAGLVGLEHIARLCGRPTKVMDSWEYHKVMEHAEDLTSEFTVKEFLATLSESSRDIKAFVDVCSEHRGTDKDSSPAEPWRRPSIEDLKSMVANQSQDRLGSDFRRFGRQASEAELKTVRSLLACATSIRERKAWLEVFESKTMPDVTPDIINLIYDENEKVARSAVNALSLVRSEMVREVALKCLRSGHAKLKVKGFDLLESNCQRGDAPELFKILKTLRSADNIHRAGMSINKFAEVEDDEEFVPIFLWLYENGSESFCREHFLEHILKWGKCPDFVLKEAQWDSGSEVQELARKTVAKRCLREKGHDTV